MTHEEIAKKAAKWWATKLLDAGSGSIASPVNPPIEEVQMDMFHANMRKSMMNLPFFDKVVKFENKLVELLRAHMDEKPMCDIKMYVDYHPNNFLAAAAVFAEIDDSMFPYKTGMHIEPLFNKIVVKEGYGKDYVELK